MLQWHSNINKLHLIWIQEMERIRNGKWDGLSLPDPHNKEKKCNIILHHSRFPLEYVKRHVRRLQKGFEANQYVASDWDNMEQVIRKTIWVQLNISPGLQFQLLSIHMYLGVHYNCVLYNALDISHNSLRVSFNTLILIRRIKRIHNKFLF